MGPFSATLFLRIDSSTSSGSVVPRWAATSAPALWVSQVTFTPAASITSHVARATSGPMPSPGMRVMVCVVTMRESSST